MHEEDFHERRRDFTPIECPLCPPTELAVVNSASGED